MKKPNVVLLRRVRDMILKDPLRVNQGTWLRKASGRRQPACGTVGCIAGWAVVLSTPKRVTFGGALSYGECVIGKTVMSIEQEAGRVLRLDDSHGLFVSDVDTVARVGSPAYARAVAKRIDDFILASGGQP